MESPPRIGIGTINVAPLEACFWSQDSYLGSIDHIQLVAYSTNLDWSSFNVFEVKTSTSHNANSSHQAFTIFCNQGLTIIENPGEHGKDLESH